VGERRENQSVSVRIDAGPGGATVSTGLAVLDHLLGELARTARLRLALEVAPGAVESEITAAAHALGEEIARLLAAPTAAGYGFAWFPAAEALAGAVVEATDRPLVASNVDFSRQRVGGLGGDVVAQFLSELADRAGLNIHIRVLEGTDPENVLRAIFKALGAAIGQACRTPEGGETQP
jgi:imidazoleglycerol-phosphate dehydratase